MDLDPYPTIENPDPNQMALFTFWNNQTRYGTCPELGYKMEMPSNQVFYIFKKPNWTWKHSLCWMVKLEPEFILKSQGPSNTLVSSCNIILLLSQDLRHSHISTCSSKLNIVVSCLSPYQHQIWLHLLRKKIRKWHFIISSNHFKMSLIFPVPMIKNHTKLHIEACKGWTQEQCTFCLLFVMVT